MIVLALAAGLILSPVQDQRNWKSDVRANGWTFRTETDAAVMFTGPGLANGTALPQLWIRYELQPGSAAPSYAGLEEFDCRAGSYRKLRVTRYPERNMGGQGTPVPADGGWEQIAQGTLLQVAFDLVCPR